MKLAFIARTRIVGFGTLGWGAADEGKQSERMRCSDCWRMAARMGYRRWDFDVVVESIQKGIVCWCLFYLSKIQTQRHTSRELEGTTSGVEIRKFRQE